MPALGGVISSREFVDLREFEFVNDGFIYFSGSVESSYKHNPTSGRVLGCNFPCGLVAKRMNNELMIEMLW
jgi:hypothetical protein